MDSVEDIKSNFYSNQINKKEAIKRLISEIERLEEIDHGPSETEILNYWDAIDTEVEVIKAFRRLNLRSREIFNILENIIVSEQDFVIKLTALRAIAELYPDKCKDFLNWLYKNDSRFEIIVNNFCLEDHCRRENLADIYDNIMWSNNDNLRELQKIVNMKTSIKVYQYILEGVDPEEAKILTIFELESHKLEKLNEDVDYYYNDYDCIYKVNGKGHIIEIYIKFGEAGGFIPQNINILQYLEKLILHGGFIRVIPNSIGKLKKLKELDLSFNSISNLIHPKHFPESLEVLCLRDNRIKVIPESILNLKNLKVLKSCSNQIEKLPNSFKNASNVINLDLSDNKIFYIPESLKELKSAKLIDLRANPKRKLPEYFDTEEWRLKIKVSPASKDLEFLIPECISKLGLDTLAKKLIFKITNLYKLNLQSNEVGLRGLIAGILYYVCEIKRSRLNGKVITQKDISDLVEVPEDIIKSNYNELMKNRNLANL